MNQVVPITPHETTAELACEEFFESAAELFRKSAAELIDWFNDTCEVLDRIIKNNFSKSHNRLVGHAESFIDIMERAIDEGGISGMPRRDQKRVLKAVKHILHIADSVFVPEISEMEIVLFCFLAELGCEKFEERGFEATLFIDADQLRLAQLMRYNYTAYVETLVALREEK